MRCARILLIGLVATVAFAWSAAAIEKGDELAAYCQSLERGAKGAGGHVYIPSTREALTCWGPHKTDEGAGPFLHNPGKLANYRNRFLRAVRCAVTLVEALAEVLRSLRLDEEGDDLGMSGADALLEGGDDRLDLGRAQAICELEAQGGDHVIGPS